MELREGVAVWYSSCRIVAPLRDQKLRVKVLFINFTFPYVAVHLVKIILHIMAICNVYIWQIWHKFWYAKRSVIYVAYFYNEIACGLPFGYLVCLHRALDTLPMLGSAMRKFGINLSISFTY